MDAAKEVRLRKRRAVLQYIEKTPDFLAASEKARASRPRPEDFTKRQWERALGHWRSRMRADWDEGAPPPKSLASPETGEGAFYPLIRMFTDLDVQRVT